MRFVTDLGKGILGKPDSKELWDLIVSQIPDDVFLRKDLKILCPAIGHGTEADIIVKRMLSLDIPANIIKNSIYVIDKYKVFTKEAIRKGYKNVIKADFLEWETDDTFDIILCSAPFKDGSKSGGQNKVYNQFSKKALSLLNNTGHLLFITPASVCKRTKRFSIVGLPGLRTVDFRAINYFDTGSRICYWHVDNTYSGNVTVVHNKGTDTVEFNEVIYDYSIIDKSFSLLYNKLREVTKKPESRMFKHNAIDMSKGRSPVKTNEHIYPVFKLNSDGTQTFIQYNKSKPKLHNRLQLVVAITKTFNEKMSIVDTKSYDMAHLSVEVKDEIEVDNVKSFIFSEYFRKHVQQWKDVDGYGYNYALMYLPIFDKTKKWTEIEVKSFIESYILVDNCAS